MGLVVPSEVFALQPKRDGEPLIYASLGTLQNGLESVFSTIASSPHRPRVVGKALESFPRAEVLSRRAAMD